MLEAAGGEGAFVGMHYAGCLLFLRGINEVWGLRFGIVG